MLILFCIWKNIQKQWVHIIPMFTVYSTSKVLMRKPWEVKKNLARHRVKISKTSRVNLIPWPFLHGFFGTTPISLGLLVDCGHHLQEKKDTFLSDMIIFDKNWKIDWFWTSNIAFETLLERYCVIGICVVQVKTVII